ncbi:hypothetical protein VV11_019225 [Trichodesmium erythraeum 21-75]|nr:hypothetical protein [Trichodesmium erythraeum 21-75]
MRKCPRRIGLIYRMIDIALPGHPYIKSALDMACWDILGKATKLPLCELFGGRIDQAITIQNSVPTGTPEEMIESIKRGQAKGEAVHTCQIGADVALDIEKIKAIGTYLPPNETATFDVALG